MLSGALDVRSFLVLAVTAFLVTAAAWASPDRPLRAMAGKSFYTSEEQAQIILSGPESVLARTDLRADVFLGERLLAHRAPLVKKRRMTVSFDATTLPEGDSEVACVLSGEGTGSWRTKAQVVKLPPQPNGVKIDRVSGGLIVDGLPLFPFGFYCYSPVQPTLAEEEVVKGFNFMSPYHGNDPEGVEERRRHMDRCAALGMKVHYQLLNVSSGGEGSESQERERLLRAEIEAFRDHPALLAWYIADEPVLHGIEPQELARTYQIIRELDPYHPVTMAFMSLEAVRAKEYRGAMDLVMRLIYPIPNWGPPSEVAGIASMVADFVPEEPLWFIPQAFGGNEGWRREPTAQEERVMTYLGVIHGATGIQYFVRHGLNSYPKSTSMWAECGRLSLEVAELAPALLSHEERPAIITSPDIVHAAAWRDRGMIVVLAVNTENHPESMRLGLPGVEYSGSAAVLFENRTVAVTGGEIEEMIDAFGTRAYQIPVGPSTQDDLQIHPHNQIVNPSFEDNPSPGTPAGCYASTGAGRGATYFVDSRVARHGRHSVRLTSPDAENDVRLLLYPVQITAGRDYRLSVWAKAADTASPTETPKDENGPMLKLALAGLGERVFKPTNEWREYSLEARAKDDVEEASTTLALLTPGTAWVDLIQLADVSPE